MTAKVRWRFLCLPIVCLASGFLTGCYNTPGVPLIDEGTLNDGVEASSRGTNTPYLLQTPTPTFTEVPQIQLFNITADIREILIGEIESIRRNAYYEGNSSLASAAFFYLAIDKDGTVDGIFDPRDFQSTRWTNIRMFAVENANHGQSYMYANNRDAGFKILLNMAATGEIDEVFLPEWSGEYHPPGEDGLVVIRGTVGELLPRILQEKLNGVIFVINYRTNSLFMLTGNSMVSEKFVESQSESTLLVFPFGRNPEDPFSVFHKNSDDQGWGLRIQSIDGNWVINSSELPLGWTWGGDFIPEGDIGQLSEQYP